MGCVPSTESGGNKVKSLPQPTGSGMDLPRQFEAGVYADFLQRALSSRDEAATMKCLQECTSDGRSEVKVEYQARQNERLIDKCQSHLSDTMAFAAALLLEPKSVMAARFLRYALLSDDPQSQQSVIEVVCCWPEENVEAMTNSFNGQFGLAAADSVKEMTREPGEIQEIVSLLLTVDRPLERSTSCEECARRLVEGAARGQLFGEDALLKRTLTTKPVLELREILELYLQKCQRDVVVDIEKQFLEGSTRQGYVTLGSQDSETLWRNSDFSEDVHDEDVLLFSDQTSSSMKQHLTEIHEHTFEIHNTVLSSQTKVIRNPWLHLSEKVHRLLTSTTDAHQMELLYTILIQNEDDLQRLKKTYKSTFFESLARDVKEDVQDPLVQRVLLKTIK